MHKFTEDELIDIAQKEFQTNGLKLNISQENNKFIANIADSDNQLMRPNYGGPANTAALAAFQAEQRYLVEEKPREGAPYAEGKDYAEKAKNRIEHLTNS